MSNIQPLRLDDFTYEANRRVNAWFNSATQSINAPTLSMYGVSGTSVPVSTWTIVPYLYDEYRSQVGGPHGSFTAPAPGMYYFDAMFSLFSTITGTHTVKAALFKNGVGQIVNSYYSDSSFFQHYRVSGMILLNRDDVVSVYAWQDYTPMTFDVTGTMTLNNRFCGTLVRPL